MMKSVAVENLYCFGETYYITSNFSIIGITIIIY